MGVLDLDFSCYDFFLFSFLELGILVNILPTCIPLPCVRVSLGERTLVSNKKRTLGCTCFDAIYSYTFLECTLF